MDAELASFVFEAEGVRIEGRGVVIVTGAPPADVASAVAGFLDAMDPTEVERSALRRMDWGAQESVTEAVLAVLKDLAEGKVSEHS